MIQTPNSTESDWVPETLSKPDHLVIDQFRDGAEHLNIGKQIILFHYSLFTNKYWQSKHN